MRRGTAPNLGQWYRQRGLFPFTIYRLSVLSVTVNVKVPSTASAICFQACKGQFSGSLDQLDSYIAVGFDFCGRKFPLPPKFMVIVENAVVGQSERNPTCTATERMIIVVVFLTALRGHSCVAP